MVARGCTLKQVFREKTDGNTRWLSQAVSKVSKFHLAEFKVALAQAQNVLQLHLCVAATLCSQQNVYLMALKVR